MAEAPANQRIAMVLMSSAVPKPLPRYSWARGLSSRLEGTGWRERLQPERLSVRF